MDQPIIRLDKQISLNSRSFPRPVTCEHLDDSNTRSQNSHATFFELGSFSSKHKLGSGTPPELIKIESLQEVSQVHVKQTIFKGEVAPVKVDDGTDQSSVLEAVPESSLTVMASSAPQKRQRQWGPPTNGL